MKQFFSLPQMPQDGLRAIVVQMNLNYILIPSKHNNL